jgi:hypothetical protein
LSGKNTADDFFDRHFLDINVRHRQFVEQGFANGDDTVGLQ